MRYLLCGDEPKRRVEAEVAGLSLEPGIVKEAWPHLVATSWGVLLIAFSLDCP